MSEFEEKLHRTWIQMLIDNNYKELAAMVIDGELTLTKTPSICMEYDDEMPSYGIAVGIPNEYYDIIMSNKYHQEIIKDSLNIVSKGYVAELRGGVILLDIKRKLIDVEDGWKDKIRNMIINSKEPNQGLVTEKVFSRKGKRPILYNEMKFSSQSEVRIAQELEERRVLFFPLPLAVRSDTGVGYEDHREVDFLICNDGVWGILEVAYHLERYEKDAEKDIWFKRSGILCIQHYPAERCYRYPSEVVNEFLQILAKYKK